MRCRDHFKNHPDHKKIYRKDSLNDWGYILDLIESWTLIPPKAIGLFRDLMPLRNQTIHYNEAYDFIAIAPFVLNKLIATVTLSCRMHFLGVELTSSTSVSNHFLAQVHSCFVPPREHIPVD
jgi:hypothetical protein